MNASGYQPPRDSLLAVDEVLRAGGVGGAPVEVAVEERVVGVHVHEDGGRREAGVAPLEGN